MIIQRPFWHNMIEQAWQQKNVIWLMGIRRVGKTSLCQSLPNVEYFDCERPRVRHLFDDPEGFLAEQKGKRIVLDEIHRLDNPSEILKIAADHFKQVNIIATGSSTLGASAKFKDTLTGRKKEIWLTPLLLQEIAAFGNENINHRLLFGGLPSFFAAEQFPEDDFRELSEAYWAKDIQDLFSVGKRYAFQKFAELLFAQSGGQFEASRFAALCEVSRQTIANYLAVLEATFVVYVVRPFATNRASEIVMAPKVYGLDTGFVCYAKGWHELRKEDTGLLWEQCVLNELHAHLQTRDIHYWRDKQGHEIDFILRTRGSKKLTAIECKYSSTAFLRDRTNDSPFIAHFQAFRQRYPQGENYVIAHDIDKPFRRTYGDVVLLFSNPHDLITNLKVLKS